MSWRDDFEYWETERKYHETKDIRYAALVLGRWRASLTYPIDPPEWAFDACVALWDRAEARIEPAIEITQGGRPYAADYARIQWVAEQHNTIGEDRSPRQLFNELLKSEGVTDAAQRKGHVQRLMRYFGRSSMTEDGPVNYHIGRVAALRARNHRQRSAERLEK